MAVSWRVRSMGALVRYFRWMLVLPCMIVLIVWSGAGCGGGRQVARISPTEATDLSGEWNDTDSRLVAEKAVRDCLGQAWLNEYTRHNARKPVITVGTIRNRSSDRVDVETFSADFERELLNSGRVRFVASRVSDPRFVRNAGSNRSLRQ